MPQALALALLNNPTLAAFSWEVRAREAAALQAALLPNPELAATAENLGNSRLEAFDGPAVLVQISQLVELGGKRAKRVRLAGLDRDLAAWDYETTRLDVLTATRKAFARLLAAQERRALAQVLAALAEEVRQTVAERVKAGKVSPLEETRAGVAAATAELERRQAMQALQSARTELMSLWGNLDATFERAEGDIAAVAAVPTLAELEHLIDQNPDLARWMAELQERQAALTLAQAERIPDITLSGGIRHFTETGDSALVAAVSIPLPLFDRRQGAIQEAYYRIAKAEDGQRAARVGVRAALARDYGILVTAYDEVTALRAQVLPGAERAFEAATEGYRQGKFSYLEVLDAQRTLFDTRGRYLTSRTTYQTAVADLERLIGVALDAVLQDSNTQTQGGRK